MACFFLLLPSSPWSKNAAVLSSGIFSWKIECLGLICRYLSQKVVQIDSHLRLSGTFNPANICQRFWRTRKDIQEEGRSHGMSWPPAIAVEISMGKAKRNFVARLWTFLSVFACEFSFAIAPTLLEDALGNSSTKDCAVRMPTAQGTYEKSETRNVLASCIHLLFYLECMSFTKGNLKHLRTLPTWGLHPFADFFNQSPQGRPSTWHGNGKQWHKISHH